MSFLDSFDTFGVQTSASFEDRFLPLPSLEDKPDFNDFAFMESQSDQAGWPALDLEPFPIMAFDSDDDEDPQGNMFLDEAPVLLEPADPAPAAVSRPKCELKTRKTGTTAQAQEAVQPVSVKETLALCEGLFPLLQAAKEGLTPGSHPFKRVQAGLEALQVAERQASRAEAAGLESYLPLTSSKWPKDLEISRTVTLSHTTLTRHVQSFAFGKTTCPGLAQAQARQLAQAIGVPLNKVWENHPNGQTGLKAARAALKAQSLRH